MKPLEFAARYCRYAMRLPVRVLDKLDESRKKQRCILGPHARLFPACRINNGRERERLRIGANSQIMGILQILPHGGEIEVGRDCFVGEWTYIWSTVSIKIGNRVLISHNVNIHDNNSHSLSAERRHRQFVDIFSTGHPLRIDDIACKPVLIEDDVWIGFNSTILKGVTIGRGAVVGACSLVTTDVAPYTVVAGSPARPIGQSFP
jgi:maltose O-acetyltransferase